MIWAPTASQVMRLENEYLPMERCTIKMPRHGVVDDQEEVGGAHGHLLPPLGCAAVTLEAFADIVLLETSYAPQYSSGSRPDGMCAAMLAVQASGRTML